MLCAICCFFNKLFLYNSLYFSQSEFYSEKNINPMRVNGYYSQIDIIPNITHLRTLVIKIIASLSPIRGRMLFNLKKKNSNVTNDNSFCKLLGLDQKFFLNSASHTIIPVGDDVLLEYFVLVNSYEERKFSCKTFLFYSLNKEYMCSPVVLLINTGLNSFILTKYNISCVRILDTLSKYSFYIHFSLTRVFFYAYFSKE